MAVRNKALVVVLVLYAISICCRLPVLNRPLSKHHEFNPATVLIAAEAWQQRGGGAQYGFVPFINYANPGDYMKDTTWAIDGKGNGIYLSYGSGMYVVPYFLFQTFHLAATPLHLQAINLTFLLLAVLLLFQALSFVFKGMNCQYQLVVGGCFIFLFNPCILWFLGNGYVNVTISLPFLIGAIYQALLILYGEKRNKAVSYCLFSLFLIAGLYIDWNVFFLTVVIGFFDIWKSIRQGKVAWLTLVAIGSVAIGIMGIVWQYTLYLSLETIVNYWKARFFTRSIEDTGLSLVRKWLMLAANILSGYLPVLLLAIAVWFKRKNPNDKPIPAVVTAYFAFTGASCCLYNLTFFNWSYIHDFALVPLAFGITFIPVYLLINRQVHQAQWYKIGALYLMLVLAQFYFINRPGKTAQNGDPYALYQTLGTQLKAEIKPDEMIFMRSQSPLLNFYAKRFTFQAHSKQEAVQKLKEWNYPKGVWVQEDKFVFKGLERIYPAK